MTLGLRCAHVARIPKPKPCKGGCGVLVLTKCAAKYCDECYAKQGHQARDVLNSRYKQDLTTAEIDATFEQALAEIKRRPRGEPDIRWTSALAGLYGRGL